jgi:DUF1680 family protein
MKDAAAVPSDGSQGFDLNHGIINVSRSPYCKLRGIDLTSVRWTQGFWADRFEQCREITIPHLWELLSDPERGHALTNLRIAAGLEEGEFVGTHWQDEWVYKWLEAVSYVYGLTRDETLNHRMDEVIDITGRAQQPDGYIATQTIVRGWPRFQNIHHHELYVMGHLMTAACIHHRMTGKTNFLDIAKKTADYLHSAFMSRDPVLAHFGFNPSYIMGTVELYRTTGERKYLDLANVFIDMRGSQPGGTDLNQDRVPLRKEGKVVGHADSLLEALERLWHDLTEKKMYVNGGVCALHRGLSIRGSDVHEAAGPEYYLPNSTAYNETCAQIGNVFWNWRMLAISGDARYADMIEHSLYNSILSGIGLDGASWFYTNPLRWYGSEHVLLSQDAYERFQPGKRHICCPSNLVRTIASIHGYTYSVSDEGLWVNLYGANTFDGRLTDGTELRLTQETDYPWDGKVKITLEAVNPPGPLFQRGKLSAARKFSIMLRIPAWASGASAKVNGEMSDVPVVPGDYAAIGRSWTAGDVIELDLPMKVRLMEGNPHVEETCNHVAVMRGPVLYCLESIDLPEDVRVSEVRMPRNVELKPRHDKRLLGGVTVLEGEAHIIREGDWTGILYREISGDQPQPVRITLVPYYAWSNRGVSQMTVWMPLHG